MSLSVLVSLGSLNLRYFVFLHMNQIYCPKCRLASEYDTHIVFLLLSCHSYYLLAILIRLLLWSLNYTVTRFDHLNRIVLGLYTFTSLLRYYLLCTLHIAACWRYVASDSGVNFLVPQKAAMNKHDRPCLFLTVTAEILVWMLSTSWLSIGLNKTTWMEYLLTRTGQCCLLACAIVLSWINNTRIGLGMRTCITLFYLAVVHPVLMLEDRG